MSRDLVSIIIPVFNGANFVAEAIESALAQTWPQTEVIVVNDGSDDGGATERAIARFGDAVRVVHKENGGVATALNAGIAAMRGDWFAWLSHDDLYSPERIATHMAALRAQSQDMIAFGDAALMDEAGDLIQTLRHTEGVPEDGPIQTGIWAVLECRLNGCAMTLPRRFIEEAGGFDPGLPTTQDYALWFRLAQRHPFLPVSGVVVRQRVHEGQGSRSTRHLEEASLLWAQMCDRLIALGPSPAATLANLRRAHKVVVVTPYLGARLFLEERLREHSGAFSVDLVVRHPRRGQDIRAVTDLVRASGMTLGRLVVTDERRPMEPALWLESWARQVNGVCVRAGHHPAADALLRIALEAGHADLVAVLDADALPAPELLTEGLRSLAAGELSAWIGGAEPMRAAIFRRDALAASGAADARGDLGAYAAFARFERVGDAASTKLRLPPPEAREHGESARRVVQVAGEGVPRLARMPRADRPTLLLMLHAWGGGTLRLVRTIAGAVGERANILYAFGENNSLLRLGSVDPAEAEVEWDVLHHGLDRPVAALKALGVSRVDVLHTIGFDDYIDDFLDRLGVPFDVTLADYHHVSSQVHLTDATGAFMGDAALDDLRAAPGRREPPRLLLRAAERRIACSRDLAWRASRLTGGLSVIPAEVPEPVNGYGFALHAPELKAGETLRVLYLGRLQRHKGRDEVIGLARRMAQEAFDGHIYCLGADDDPLPMDVLSSGHVTVLGGYVQEMLNPLICRIRPHLAWLPFRAPETFSFALSDCMAQGLPILATGIGAIPERVEGRPGTWLLPLSATAQDVLAWLRRLVADGLRTPPAWMPTDHLPPLRRKFYERDYLVPR